ncbi:hypothetical protein NKH84_31435 [Mesorhizobium sp. M0902]|uniref:hypothetical protein n=1 Tax=Mesorhizobium sp. M0902 TaxID=2957021 RepID=UPI0033362A6C
MIVTMDLLLPGEDQRPGNVYLVSLKETPWNKAAALFANWLMSMPGPAFDPVRHSTTRNNATVGLEKF